MSLPALVVVRAAAGSWRFYCCCYDSYLIACQTSGRSPHNDCENEKENERVCLPARVAPPGGRANATLGQLDQSERPDQVGVRLRNL